MASKWDASRQRGWFSIRGSCAAPDVALPGRRMLDATSLPVQLHASAAPSPRALPTLSLARTSLVGPPILHLMAIPPLDQPLTQHPQWEQVAQDRVLLGFACLQGWMELHSLLGQPLPVLNHPHHQKVFLHPCPPRCLPTCSAGGSRANPSERAPHLLQAPFPLEGWPQSPSFGGTARGDTVPQPRTAPAPWHRVSDAAARPANACDRHLPSADSQEPLRAADKVIISIY